MPQRTRNGHHVVGIVAHSQGTDVDRRTVPMTTEVEGVRGPSVVSELVLPERPDPRRVRCAVHEDQWGPRLTANHVAVHFQDGRSRASGRDRVWHRTIF